MSDRISLKLRRIVQVRALHRCEYCLVPDDEPLFQHEPDHIVAVKHQGPTEASNLAYACFVCNHAKGSDIASLDPATGALTSLFHPRQHHWGEHFQLNRPIIVPLSPEGRVTIFLLQFNTPARVALRANLMAEGRYHIPADEH